MSGLLLDIHPVVDVRSEDADPTSEADILRHREHRHIVVFAEQIPIVARHDQLGDTFVMFQILRRVVHRVALDL